MTCIVGFVEGDAVWMGGDSAGVGGYYALTVRSDERCFGMGRCCSDLPRRFVWGNYCAMR